MEQPDMIKSSNESKWQIWGCCWREEEQQEEDSLIRPCWLQFWGVKSTQSEEANLETEDQDAVSLPVLGPAVLSNCSSTLSRPQKEVPRQAAGIQQHGGRLRGRPDRQHPQLRL